MIGRDIWKHKELIGQGRQSHNAKVCWRKPEHPEKTHQARTKYAAGIKPGTIEFQAFLRLQKLVFYPTKDATPDPTEEQEKITTQCDGDYFCDWRLSLQDKKTPRFPGPLLSKNMKKDNLVRFIWRKAQECLINDDHGRDQQAAYVYWLIMEKICTTNGTVMMTDIAPLLLKAYEAFKNEQEKLDHWCLLPACRLSHSCDSEDELRESVIKMGDNLASRGQIYPAHICYVVAHIELGPYVDRTSFTLIGSDSLPFGKSAMCEAVVRTEVYEYALWPNLRLVQSNFQILKLLHASWLADSGFSTQAQKYCRTIAMAVAAFPNSITATLICCLIALSEELYRGKAKQPTWLANVRHLHLLRILGKNNIFPRLHDVDSQDSQVHPSQVHCGLSMAERSFCHLTSMELQTETWGVDSDDDTLIHERPITYLNPMGLQPEDWEVDPESDGILMPEKSTTYWNTVDLQTEDWDADNEDQEVPTFHPSCLRFLTDPHAERFVAQYKLGNLLGTGGFGSVYEGVRKRDGLQVAIKYISKEFSNIRVSGESSEVPLEVALMQSVSMPPQCKNVLQLLDWFELPTYILLVLERPIPCMDVYSLYENLQERVPEQLAKRILMQVIVAAIHCQQRGVFHRDIKMENLLYNSDTNEVKLIDFGCGDVWNDTAYHEYEGTPAFCPPEWILKREYYAYPMTIWSIGILLFTLVSGRIPFLTEDEIVEIGILNFKPGLSKACCRLIEWYLEKDQTKRPSFQEILEHEWFTEDLEFLD